MDKLRQTLKVSTTNLYLHGYLTRQEAYNILLQLGHRFAEAELILVMIDEVYKKRMEAMRCPVQLDKK